MKKKKNRIKKSWMTVVFLVIAVAFSTLIGYATYTGITVLKRVVSTRAGAGILFSSNYMKHGTTPQTSVEYRDYNEFLDVDGNPIAADPSYNMVICNYSQGDMATWYTSNDIEYTVLAQLYLNEKYSSEDIESGVDASLLGEYKRPTSEDIGSLKFGIKKSDDADYSYFSGSVLDITIPASGYYSLSKTEASTDTFSLLFDKSELKKDNPKFWIKVTATPTSISGGEVEQISGYVGTCKSAEGGASWTGFIDDEDYTNTDYDAYNYIISGSGKGSFYFAWDDSKVKPNEFALLNYQKGASDTVGVEGNAADVTDWTNYVQYGSTAAPTGTWKYIKLSVDSEIAARYEFQMYKTGGEDYRSTVSKYTDYYFEAE